MNEESTFTTYIGAARKLIENNPDFYTEDQKHGMMSFAKYLDSFQTLGSQLEMLAMRAARKVDRELLEEFIKEIGMEKAKDIARRVNARHLHGKKLADIT